MVSLKGFASFFIKTSIYDPKKATHAVKMMSVLCVAIFWVVNASSGEKSCLQFSIPTGSGIGGEGDVSNRLKLAIDWIVRVLDMD